jgi:phosphatidylglycerophosphate synthase
LAIRTALIICPSGDPGTTVERPLLGLNVGERLLLALEMAGIDRVAFLGTGPKPTSTRTKMATVTGEDLLNNPREGEFILLPGDLVFDRQLILSPDRLERHHPVRIFPFSDLKEVVTNAAPMLQQLGTGRATSGDGYAIRVMDSVSARRAKRSLLASLRKPIDGFISRNLNRHISIFFSSLLVYTGLRPNQLTVFIMGMGVAAAIFAALPEYRIFLVLAALLFQGQSIFDGCDGEIARLTYRFSPLGQWLDTIGDDMTNYLFCLGLAIGQARMLDCPWLYVVGGITFLSQLALSGIMYQRIAKMGTGDLLALPDTLTTGQYKGVIGLVLKFFRLITKRDFFVFIIAVITALGYPLAAFITMAIGGYIALAGVAMNELRLRKMEREN